MLGERVDENDLFLGQRETWWLMSLRLERSYYSRILKNADQVARPRRFTLMNTNIRIKRAFRDCNLNDEIFTRLSTNSRKGNWEGLGCQRSGFFWRWSGVCALGPDVGGWFVKRCVT